LQSASRFNPVAATLPHTLFPHPKQITSPPHDPPPHPPPPPPTPFSLKRTIRSQDQTFRLNLVVLFFNGSFLSAVFCSFFGPSLCRFSAFSLKSLGYLFGYFPAQKFLVLFLAPGPFFSPCFRKQVFSGCDLLFFLRFPCPPLFRLYPNSPIPNIPFFFLCFVSGLVARPLFPFSLVLVICSAPAQKTTPFFSVHFFFVALVFFVLST